MELGWWEMLAVYPFWRDTVMLDRKLGQEGARVISIMLSWGWGGGSELMLECHRLLMFLLRFRFSLNKYFFINYLFLEKFPETLFFKITFTHYGLAGNGLYGTPHTTILVLVFYILEVIPWFNHSFSKNSTSLHIFLILKVAINYKTNLELLLSLLYVTFSITWMLINSFLFLEIHELHQCIC